MIRGRIVAILWSTCLIPDLGAAPEVSPQGPIAGHVLDERIGALRTIYGIPGATTLGAPLPLDFRIQQAAIDPAGAFALVTREGSPSELYVLRRDENGGFTVSQQLSAEALEIDGIALAASGTAAVVYSKSRAMLQAIRDLPAAASLSDPVALGGAGTLVGVAVDGEASSALVMLTGETGSHVARVSLRSGPAPALVPILDRASAISVSSTGAPLVVAADMVYALPSGGQASPLYGPDGGASDPIALCGDSSSHVAVVNRSTRTVAIWSATPDLHPLVELDWTPDRCQWLGGNRFLLNGPGRAPLQILELLPTVRVLLTPADLPEAP